MVSATDIITYIGIPLAVLGVMPILYTFLSAFYTRFRVSRALQASNIRAVVHSRLMSGIVDAEVTAYELQPLPREDPGYWKEKPLTKGIQGSEWRAYPWTLLETMNQNGPTILRLQMRDPIILPAANIEFDALVSYLVDLGACICPKGLAQLREFGVGARPSTCIMKVDTRSSVATVLEVSTRSINDGTLSLTLHQCPLLFNSGDRHNQTLPPSWIKVEVAGPTERWPQRRSPLAIIQVKIPRTFLIYLGSEGIEKVSDNTGGYNIISNLSVEARSWLTCAVSVACCDSSDEENSISFQGILYQAAISSTTLFFCREAVLPLRSDRYPLSSNDAAGELGICSFLAPDISSLPPEPGALFSRRLEHATVALQTRVAKLRGKHVGVEMATHLKERQAAKEREMLEAKEREAKERERLEKLIAKERERLEKVEPKERERQEWELHKAKESLGLKQTNVLEHLQLLSEHGSEPERILPIRFLSIQDMWTAITNKIDVSEHSFLFDPQFPPSAKTITYVSLCDPVFLKALVECLDELYNGFVGRADLRNPWWKFTSGKASPSDMLPFICALVIIEAIGKHAEKLLLYGDTRDCLREHRKVFLS